MTRYRWNGPVKTNWIYRNFIGEVHVVNGIAETDGKIMGDDLILSGFEKLDDESSEVATPKAKRKSKEDTVSSVTSTATVQEG